MEIYPICKSHVIATFVNNNSAICINHVVLFPHAFLLRIFFNQLLSDEGELSCVKTLIEASQIAPGGSWVRATDGTADLEIVEQ